MNDIFAIIKTADKLTGNNLTEKDTNNKSKKVNQIYDFPLFGKNGAALAPGEEVTIIEQSIDTGRTVVAVGMMGIGMEDTLITITGENESPIIKNVFGDLLNNERIFPFTCPHVVKPGSKYSAKVKNDKAAAANNANDIAAKKCKLAILAVKLQWN